MGDVKRSVRVSARLIKELAWVLARSVRDPRVARVTITKVEMPDDLRTARVLVRLLDGGDDEAKRTEALQGLSRASGMLRAESARRMGLRFAPELSFAYDDGQDHVSRIEQLLHEVKTEEASRRPR
jgi:ribosome-binding factor A